MLAKVILTYHVLEKGLTMPNRRLDFGHQVVLDLMGQINDFIKLWGSDPQVLHAVGTVKSYFKLHRDSGFDFSNNCEYWNQVEKFCACHENIPDSQQYIFSREEFFGDVKDVFGKFAHSRHTVRHYCGSIPYGEIVNSVALAQTAPSACNRQHSRVHCVSDHNLRNQLLSLQNGNRGFGMDADKLLVVTTDLHDIQCIEERNDPYVNAGIFIMNLCYALHYYKIGCCILNWHVVPETDLIARELLHIPCSESIVAIIACGLVPDKFEVAQSPKKDIKAILFNH
jgi:nitroreductase